VAERSGDTAFRRKKIMFHLSNLRSPESGAALRFTPQSKSRGSG